MALKGPDARMARRCRSRDAVLAAVMLLWAEATDGRVAEGGTGRRLLGHGHHSSTDSAMEVGDAVTGGLQSIGVGACSIRPSSTQPTLGAETLGAPPHARVLGAARAALSPGAANSALSDPAASLHAANRTTKRAWGWGGARICEQR